MTPPPPARPPSGQEAVDADGAASRDLRQRPAGRRGERTRSRLLDAARVVFEREGYVATRVSDITTEARVAHGTFYTYFDSKLDVLRAVIASVVEEMEAASQTHGPSDTILDRIEFANRMFFDVYRRNAPLMEIFEQVSATEPDFRAMRRQIRMMWVRRTERSIRSMQQSGEADPHLDARCAASALGSMADNFAFIWLVLGEPFDEDVAVDTVSRLWAQAIGLDVPPQRWSVIGSS